MRILLLGLNYAPELTGKHLCREQVLQRFGAEMEGLSHTKTELAIRPQPGLRTIPQARSEFGDACVSA